MLHVLLIKEWLFAVKGGFDKFVKFFLIEASCDSLVKSTRGTFKWSAQEPSSASNLYVENKSLKFIR